MLIDTSSGPRVRATDIIVVCNVGSVALQAGIILATHHIHTRLDSGSNFCLWLALFVLMTWLCAAVGGCRGWIRGRRGLAMWQFLWLVGPGLAFACLSLAILLIGYPW